MLGSFVIEKCQSHRIKIFFFLFSQDYSIVSKSQRIKEECKTLQAQLLPHSVKLETYPYLSSLQVRVTGWAIKLSDGNTHHPATLPGSIISKINMEAVIDRDRPCQ